jgi:drug/metabolite transporter (DMT)-like permease
MHQRLVVDKSLLQQTSRFLATSNNPTDTIDMSQSLKQIFNNRKTWAHLALLSAQLCFSGWHIVGSLALKDGADPFVFVLYRELFASLMMALLYFGVQKQPLFNVIEPQDYRRFFGLGVCSFINVVGAMLALKYISPTRFAIFQPGIPCIATVISILVGLEGFTWMKTAGILMAVSGAIITELWNSGGDEDEKNVYLGTAIVTCQVFGMANLIVFVKPILNKYNSLFITFVYYSIGTVLTMILFLVFTYQYTVSDLYFDGSLLPWLGLCYASIFATVYTYNVYSWAGREVSPSASTVYSTFQPVGTILLSFLILGKIVTLSEGLGTFMVIAGLITNIWGQRLERKKPGHGSSSTSALGFKTEEELLLDPSQQLQYDAESNSQQSEDQYPPFASLKSHVSI